MVHTGTLAELINFYLPAGTDFLWLKTRPHAQVVGGVQSL
jgi:hypothetical protein